MNTSRWVRRMGIGRAWGLAALFLLTNAANSEALQYGDFGYESNGNTWVITHYSGSGGAVLIPNMIDGKDVTSIADVAFNNCGSMTSVMIPKSVTNIGDMAFYACTALTRVTIPDSVIRLGSYHAMPGASFQNCSSLTSVTIGTGLTTMGPMSFSGCTSLTNVTIGAGVANIMFAAFSGCTKLQTLCFNGNAPSLGDQVFSGSTPSTAVVSYLATTTGWGPTFGGLQTFPCQECREEFVAVDFTPSDKEESVFWDDPQISATFSANMAPGSINTGTFTVSYYGSTDPIPGSYSVEGKVVRYTPTAPLVSSGRKIVVKIKGGADGVKSAGAGNLSQNYTWSFTTMPFVSVRAVAAQVVDGLDWVAGKEASVRIQALWGQIDYTAVFAITGKVTVVWNGGTESVKDDFRWVHWNGSISGMMSKDFTQTERIHGNAAVFSSPHGTMPASMLYSGTNSIQATVELGDNRGRTKQFICQTSVRVKPLAIPNSSWAIHFTPLNVGPGTNAAGTAFTIGTSLPFMDAFSRDQVEFLQRVYPLPESAIANGCDLTVPDIYSYWNHKNLLNCISDSQYISALAADMDDYREACGLDVLIGVVPTGWLKARSGGSPGQAGANWFNVHGLPVAFVEEDVLDHITAHEVGHIYAYPGVLGPHPEPEWDFSGFNPVTEALIAPGFNAYRGDFMVWNSANIASSALWAERGTYRLLMDHFVAGGATSKRAGPKQVATEVLAVRGILIQTGASCTSEIVRIFPVANQAASTDSPTGDFSVEALNGASAVLSSVRIDPGFEPDALGNQIATFKVYFSNPSSIARIAVKKLGVRVGSISKPTPAPTVAVTASAVMFGPLTASWTVVNSSGAPLTYSVFYRPETNRPWTLLAFGITNRALTLGAGIAAIGDHAQIRVVANDGFNTVEGLSGLFQVINQPVVKSCSPTNGATFVPVSTDVEITFSTPMRPGSIAASTVKLKDNRGMAVAASLVYNPSAQKAVLTPAVPLTPLSDYTVRVEWGAESIQGTHITVFNSGFRTSSGSLPPTVVLTGPSTSAVLAVDMPQTISATAVADTNRVINKVEFVVDGQKIGEDTTAPFTCSWTPTQTGTSLVTAVASDDEAGTGLTSPANFRVAKSSVPKTLYSHGNPSEDEQGLLEMINDARENPPVEGLRLAGTSDANVLNSYQTYGVSTNQLKTDFASYPARPPLAFNSNLMASARRHALDMAAHNFENATGSDGSTVSNRIFQAGYGAHSRAENIFAFAKSVFHGHAGMNADWGSGQALTRRINLMNDTGVIYREIGISQVSTNYPGPATNVGPRVDCVDFGLINGRSFLVGVVYADLDGDWKYDPGEGLSGVAVQPDRGGYSAVSSASGGYAIPLTVSNGVLTVTASGGCLPDDIVTFVTLDGQNKRLTFLVVDGNANTEPTAQADGLFGVRTNRFGFNINWFSDRIVVVEANTNLTTTNWVRVGTNNLTAGSSYFSDPQWTNYRGRFYRIHWLP